MRFRRFYIFRSIYASKIYEKYTGGKKDDQRRV